MGSGAAESGGAEVGEGEEAGMSRDGQPSERTGFFLGLLYSLVGAALSLHAQVLL